MKKLLNLFLILMFVFTLNSAFASNTIRVGISDNTFSTYAHSAQTLSATKAYTVSSKNESVAQVLQNGISKFEILNGLFNFYIDDKLYAEGLEGPITIQSEGIIELCEINRKGKQSGYEGDIQLVATSDNKFNIVNIIDFQQYLKGVVPNEMPVSFGLSALKAQAVAARNYAGRTIGSGKIYDICDSVACQVYFGTYTRTALSDRAVEETNSIYALYNYEPILALYSSTAGGYTENYENAFSPSSKYFPSFAIPYLKAVPDNPEITPLVTDDLMRKFLKYDKETLDSNSPFYRWTTVWEKDELLAILNKTLKNQSSTGYIEPVFTDEDFIEDLSEIIVKKRGESGKAIEIEIVTPDKKWIVKKELIIRRVFLKGTRMLASANVVFDFENDIITASGAGYGHGVGMSQYGAGKMSLSGISYDKILKHYYSSISLGTLPLELAYEIPQNTYTQQFYINIPKAYIVIDNKKKTGNFIFSINGNEFSLNMNSYPSKVIKIALDAYLKNGLNTIEYKSLSAKGKSTKVWVEIVEN